MSKSLGRHIQVVYRIISKVNGKIYIGSTSDFQYRKVNWLSCLKHNKSRNIKLQTDYNLYGSSNFTFEILEKLPNIGKKELRQREQYWLDTVKIVDSTKIYNIAISTFTSNKGTHMWVNKIHPNIGRHFVAPNKNTRKYYIPFEGIRYL